MDLAASLEQEAVRSNERRLLVLAGDRSRALDRVREILDGTDADETVYVGPESPLPCRAVEPSQTAELMGTTQQRLVYDCHERCEPNALGRVVGTVDGGGLLVLLTPPLAPWPDRRDAFDATLAVPPFASEDVSGAFRQRLVETLRTHRGVAIVDVDTDTVERDGLVDPPPRLPRKPPTVPETAVFPQAAYEACLTGDQVSAVQAFERLREAGQAVVVEADRGRGKSSAAGLAAACLAAGGGDVLVTAPAYRNAATLFERATELLTTLAEPHNSDDPQNPHRIETENGRIRFEPPAAAASLPDDPDHVFADEAAALPVKILEALLSVGSTAFTTTVHGYEGAGRGFSVRFRDRLADSGLSVTERRLGEPIRYAAGDPIEVWSFHALGLGARPAADQLVADARPESVSYRELSTADLLADEHLLREVFGLLVLAHYRTEPNDFARLLDAPNVSVHALLADGHVVSVALLAREGGLSAALCERIYDGERIRGNLIPDLLTSQLRDEDAGRPVGTRVLRIASHSAARSRGLGSQLLDEIQSHARGEGLDWVGVGYGATPALVSFWTANGYRAVHLGVSKNERSGEHSVIMLKPLTAAGRALFERHTEWFLRRFPDTLANALSGLPPDLVRAVCRAIDGTPALELTPFEWRVLRGIPGGTAIYDTAPRPVALLAFRYLTDDDADCLSPRAERLLVRKTLQARPWDEVAAEMEYVSASACMRALGACIEPLLSLYGPETGSEGGDADGGRGWE